MARRWTAKDIPDLTGKVIIVTGGNSGLGFEACKLYSKKNAKVIMASRNIERCNKARQRILKSNPKASIEIMKLNLADLESVKDFVVNFKSRYDKLDILLNNAGVMFTPNMRTKDGFEFQNGINHLGHFALTAQLFPIIKNTKNSRIVNVSSLGHKFGSMDWEDYMFEKSYNATDSYGRSKLSNLLFTYELDRRVKLAKIDVKVLAAHPGVSNTNLFNTWKNRWWFYIIRPLMAIFIQSARKGTLPEVRASVDPTALSGEYYGPRGLGESAGYPVLVKSNEESYNKEDAKRLWEESQKLTKTRFEI